MKDLKDLELTSEDFDLLIDGLEHLPKKDLAGDLMADLMGSILLKDGQEKKKFENDREREREKHKMQEEILIEKIRILQGKLFTLRSHFRENKLLKDAKDLLK